jgi:uncharacterized protein
MRFFRYYPWVVQLLFFGLLAYSFLMAASLIIPGVLLKKYGFSIEDIESISEHSTPALIQVALKTQAAFSLLVYFFPAYIFALCTHPRPAEYLGLQLPQQKNMLLIAVAVIIGLMPFLIILDSGISTFHWSAAVRKSQQSNNDIFKAFMSMSSFKDFLWTFLILAILPAFSEELFFRGLLFRFAKRTSKKTLPAVLFTALIFALSHSTITGFLSIFIAGILLAYIYHYTGSLVCNILAHLFFNGLQIILAYCSNFNAGLKNFLEANPLSLQFIATGAVGLVIFGIAGRFLLKSRATLSENWPQDFAAGEALE